METDITNHGDEQSAVIPPLPFTYERVSTPEEAEFNMWRINPVKIGGQANEPTSDEAILAEIERRKKEQEWFYQDYWRDKGKASEQIEFDVDGNPITLYNFNGEQPLDEARLQSLADAMRRLGSHFPDAFAKLRWILIDNTQQTSVFGDTEQFPVNGQVIHGLGAFRFFPRGIKTDIPHRIAGANNLEGTFVHETSHLIQDKFREEWRQKFKWDFCHEYPEDWELRLPPEGGDKRYYHKQTGEMAPQYIFPLQPENCVTRYAKLSMDEDICESTTAYIYNPELLKGVSPEKFEILEGHDAKRADIDLKVSRIDKDNILMPEIKSEVIKYYIKEPEGD